MDDKLRTLVEYAILVPSGHNSQPWKFRIGKKKIEIFPDYTRARRAVDPNNRELFISMGAVLKNILVAGNDLGLELTYKIVANKIEVELVSEKQPKEKMNEIKAIKERQTNRGEYFVKAIEEKKWKEIENIAGKERTDIKYILNITEKRRLANLAYEADLVWYKNKELMLELEEWLRDDLETAKDGLPTGVLNFYKVAAEIKYLFAGDSQKAKEIATKDKERLLKSPVMAIITSKGETTDDWVEAGELYEELALELTKLGLSNSIFNRPLELTGYRKMIAEKMNIKGKAQLLVRIGYAIKLAARTPRRPIEEMLI